MLLCKPVEPSELHMAREWREDARKMELVCCFLLHICTHFPETVGLLPKNVPVYQPAGPD